MLFQIKAPEIKECSFHIFSSSLLNIIILVSNRSSPVTKTLMLNSDEGNVEHPERVSFSEQKGELTNSTLIWH